MEVRLDVSKDRGASIFRGQEFQVIIFVLFDPKGDGITIVRSVDNNWPDDSATS